MSDLPEISLSMKTRQQMKCWICDLLRYSNCLFGGYDAQGAIDHFFQYDPMGNEVRPNPYARFFEELKFSEKDYCDIAAVIVASILQRGSTAEIVLSMIENHEVLLDADISSRWLAPLAKAERTSVVYQRGLALVKAGLFGVAREIMQDAADQGDVRCALYLIEQKIKGGVKARFVKDAKTADSKPVDEVNRTSVAYECGVAWIEHRNLERGEKILQTAADQGDVPCALYLIKNYEARKRNTHAGLDGNAILRFTTGKLGRSTVYNRTL